MGSTVLNHLGPNKCFEMNQCTGHQYWLLHDITWMVTAGCPPLMALHVHCWSRTGQLWCMWNSQSVSRVFWNLVVLVPHAYLCLCLVVILVAVGGHMISMKQHQKRKLETTKNTSCTDCILTTHPPNLITTSNRFQQSIGWTANFRIKPLLISIKF